MQAELVHADSLAALVEFIESGGFDHQVRGAHRAYAQQVARMSDAVAGHSPAECLMTRPRGGFVLGWNCRLWPIPWRCIADMAHSCQ